MAKNDGLTTCTSDNIVNACHRFYVMLCLLLNSMLKHTLSPGYLTTPVVIPIPKKRSLQMMEETTEALL